MRRNSSSTPLASILPSTVLLAAGFAGSWGCAPPPESAESVGSANSGGATGAATANDGVNEPLDAAQLDRTEASGECGYPGPGGAGYGAGVGDRLANSAGFLLKACEGEVVDLSSFMCPEDGNRAVLVNIGAGWCGPCQEETLEFPELYEEYDGRGLEIVQVMFQDWSAQNPTRSFCEDWRSGDWEGGAVDLDLGFPVLIDQTNEWTGIYLQDPAAATPINMLIDANGNIRWKSEGQKVGLDVLRTQINAVLASPYEIP